MVSKLSILKTYYQLPLEDQFSFTYEDEHYYLTNKPFPIYYQKYISLLQINPLKIINNIYQQKNSQGYILYQVQSIPLDIQKIISLSLIPQETKTIKVAAATVKPILPISLASLVNCIFKGVGSPLCSVLWRATFPISVASPT